MTEKLKRCWHGYFFARSSRNVVYPSGSAVHEKETASACAPILFCALSKADRVVNERCIPSANRCMLGHSGANITSAQARHGSFVCAWVAPCVFRHKRIDAIGVVHLSRLRQRTAKSARPYAVTQPLCTLGVILNTTGRKGSDQGKRKYRVIPHRKPLIPCMQHFHLCVIRTTVKAQAEPREGTQDRATAADDKAGAGAACMARRAGSAARHADTGR